MKKFLSILLFLPAICFSQIVINDLPSGGAIGTAANTVNKGSLFHINQTTSGQTLTVPNPTATNFSKFIYVLDIGSASFTLSPGGNLTPGTGVILVWTGTKWNVAGNGSPPSSTVTQSITNGDVSFSPSGDAVFDALALKQDVFTSQSANTIFSGPSTGSAAAPAFRSLVANDIPSLTASKITDLGTAATKNVGTTSGTVCAGDDNRIKGFNIINYSTVFSPADATTYYLGSVGTLTTTSGGLSSIARRKYINVTGTITSAQVYIINNSTDASTETSTLYIRINDATDYTISTGIQFSSTSSGKVYNITGLSIPVTAGDYEVSKLVTATWATNPVQSHMEIVYYIQ